MFNRLSQFFYPHYNLERKLSFLYHENRLTLFLIGCFGVFVFVVDVLVCVGGGGGGGG